MDYLANSADYTLNFSFNQVESLNLGPNEDYGQGVIAQHGICWILTMDWLESRLTEKAFVVSKQSVLEKPRQLRKIIGNQIASWDLAYQQYKPNLRLGNPRRRNMSADNCRNSVDLGQGQGVALHLGPELDQLGGTAHLIAVVRNGNGYMMFDPNFGEFQCARENQARAWVAAICQHRRNNGTRYIDWANNITAIPFR